MVKEVQMRKLLVFTLLCLPISSFALEVDTEGSSYRILDNKYECGVWGIGEVAARKKAQDMGSKLCWGSGVSILGSYKISKKCIELENGVVEHISASARFQCNFRSNGSNSETQCKEGEFTCYTNWGNLPYCSRNRRCHH